MLIRECWEMKNWTRVGGHKWAIFRKVSSSASLKHAHKEEMAIRIEKASPKAKEISSGGLREMTGR